MSHTVLKFQGEPLTAREIQVARYADAKARCAALWAAKAGCDNSHRAHIDEPCEFCLSRAAACWPLPTVTRPRVVTHDGLCYRVVDGRLESRLARGGKWDPSITNVDRIRLLADLLDNPTETVEADE